MDEENEDPMFIDPEILKKELVISLPILSESDIEMMLNGEDSSTEETSSEVSEKDKYCPKRDQRRLNLFNDPNYGIILCFMDKFRSYINLKNYPLRIFEDNLISEQEKFSGRFVDLHLSLLKKVSSGKTVERDQFVSSMTKFAYRFNRDDGDHLEQYGYSKARVDVKLRILKELLEKQFDRNQPLKNAVANKSAFELCAKPFGRDRLGASYWLFTDTDCFIRLFREDIDANRSWINLAKNQQELENLIKILVTDYLVRKKFPEWKFPYESFNSLPPSSVFEEHYSPDIFDIKNKNEIIDDLSPSSIRFRSDIIKTEHIDLDPIVNLDRELPSSPPLSSFMIENVKISNILDITSDQESINSVEINGNRMSTSSSSNDTSDAIYSPGFSQELNKDNQQNKEIEESIKKIQERHITRENNNTDTPVIIVKPSLEQGIKRKLVDYDDTESEMEDNEKNDETSQESHQTPVNKETKDNPDLPIALRRPRRSRRLCQIELSPDSSSTNKSTSQDSIEKKFVNKKWKRSNQSSKSNSRRQRSRRNHRGRTSMNGLSSTTSDDHQPSDDDDDDDFCNDYLPKNTMLDELLNGDLLDEEEDDDDDDYIPRRTAKTVAQCYKQTQLALKPCSTCSQTDRPEVLLLCEDCNDAYHLECIKPELLSIPNDDWYCPLCEHKRLCDGLIEKLLILIKDERQFEMKRTLSVSKRRNRLTNVAVNLERYVQKPMNKRKINIITSSDDNDNDGQASEKKTNTTNDDDDDDDSVYGCKNRENHKPLDKGEEQTGKRRVRSCRRKAQTYSFDDYDKKFQEAMVNTGITKELTDVDSEDSHDMILHRKSARKRARYEEDDDFDVSSSKNDGDFVRNRCRIISDDSRSDARDNDDIGMSDDDNAWRNRRQSSASSISKKKSNPKSNGNNRRKSTIISEDDTIVSEDTPSNLPLVTKIKSEPTVKFDSDNFNKNVFGTNEIDQQLSATNAMGPNLFDKNRFGRNVFGISEIAQNISEKTDDNKKKVANNNKQRPPRRAASTKKKCLIQQENISDEEEDECPLAPKHKPTKKRLGSGDSSVEDDDDYEKLAHKRRLFHQGRAITRKSITSHIKKLVGDEDDAEEEDEEGKKEEDSANDKSSDGANKDDNNNSKQTNKNSQYDELRLSDDDDFPDDQEILQTTGLINLKRPLSAPKAAAFRVPFMPTIQSYQYTMADPTANFDFTCPPEIPTAQPSDSSQANGDNSLPTTT